MAKENLKIKPQRILRKRRAIAQQNPEIGIDTTSWTDMETKTLETYYLLRRKLRRIMITMAMLPIVSYVIFFAGHEVFLLLGQSMTEAYLTAAGLGLAVFVGLSVVLWLNGMFVCERCFVAINRRSQLAGQRIGLDDTESARTAADDLFETWAHKLLLTRRIRDGRTKFVLMTVLASLLIALLVVAFGVFDADMPAESKLITIGFGMAIATSAIIRSIMFANSLLRLGGKYQEENPANKIAARLEALISEVKSLRSGARLAA